MRQIRTLSLIENGGIPLPSVVQELTSRLRALGHPSEEVGMGSVSWPGKKSARGRSGLRPGREKDPALISEGESHPPEGHGGPPSGLGGPPAGIRGGPGSASRPDDCLPDPYKERLIKLIPTEVVGSYLACNSLMSAAAAPGWLHWGVFVFFLLATPGHLHIIENVRDKGQLITSTGAYLVWVMNIGTPLHVPPLFGGIALILYPQ